MSTPTPSGNLSESAESKVERLGQAFKQNVRELREKSACLDLVFLVDESSSVGSNNFQSELRFIRKMLSDFPVAPENTRVALVTFSSKTHVVTRVDHISAPKSHQHKCSLFNQEIPSINYRGGGTYTKGAFQRAAVSPIFRGKSRQLSCSHLESHVPSPERIPLFVPSVCVLAVKHVAGFMQVEILNTTKKFGSQVNRSDDES
ncbi:PREDICTED: sushi, von Willebrand factor type A, EGF and pentraxin domain-containing protein 1-like [Poecilia mexicana]|uniref:sushi, von Willebrand factor type A, EGF and pentraxin domain-containing protein 1-like n=1 Tax=Poecilia mexicana TaxID=48701 RepID=UPI00072DF85F|nr:PREDICTED: sushi, von Willebrand factor type A, EGF and pentraxin domain-containing protein 1-like [Poecilia mexicana]